MVIKKKKEKRNALHVCPCESVKGMERQDVLRQFINMTKAKAYYHTVTVSASVCVHTSTPQHELNTSCLPVPVRHFYKLQVNTW